MNDSMELCPNCEVPARVVRARRVVALGQRRVEIDDERMRCDICEEEFYTPEQADRRQRIAAEQARAEDGLLTPREIRAIRDRLGLSQENFERLINSGPKTCVRWERGTVFQNHTTDELLRLIDAVPAAVAFLAIRHGVNVPALTEWTRCSAFVGAAAERVTPTKAFVEREVPVREFPQTPAQKRTVRPDAGVPTITDDQLK